MRPSPLLDAPGALAADSVAVPGSASAIPSLLPDRPATVSRNQ